MLELYAHPASQPSRSVLWLCALNDAPCRVHHDPQNDLSDVNPRRQIPLIVDGDFTLSEMPAILGFLADKYGWQDWYPAGLAARAHIHQYLHTHHTLTRLATLKLMAPHVLAAFAEPPIDNATSILNNVAIATAMADEDKLASGQAIMREVLNVIEQHYLHKAGCYIGGLAQPSIADLACYEEIAQLPWANLLDLQDYPNCQAWLDNMATLPVHEAIHRYNFALGDIATTANTMPRMMAAISEGLDGLVETGFTLDLVPRPAL